MAKRGRPRVETNPITRERIKEARERKGYSKMELSRLMNIDAAAIRKWENSKNISIPSWHLEAISRICEVPLEWLKGESIPDTIQNSINILKGFNPDESKDYASEISEEAKSESLAIIYALKMCGYSISDIADKGRFSDYMTKSIRNAIEVYMTTLNSNK